MKPYVGMWLKCGRDSQSATYTFAGTVEIIAIADQAVISMYRPKPEHPGHVQNHLLNVVCDYLDTGWWVPTSNPVPEYMRVSEGL